VARLTEGNEGHGGGAFPTSEAGSVVPSTARAIEIYPPLAAPQATEGKRPYRSSEPTSALRSARSTFAKSGYRDP